MNIVFFTGAGISVPSGLPTYRGTDGIYTNNPDLPQHLTMDTWRSNPELVLAATAKMKDLINKANPNPAHYAIAKLQDYFNVTVVTQNVDSLHTRARSTLVYELHGNINKTKTDEFGTRSTAVLFGEDLDADVWQKSVKAIDTADVIVAVGTSGDVAPASYLLDIANEKAFKNKIKFYYLSLDPPEKYLPFAVTIFGSAEQTVPTLCESLITVFH